MEKKLYAFVANSHYHIITMIDKDSYGVVDLCTNRYSEERFKTLKECLDWACERWKVSEFDNYRQLFRYFTENEDTYDVMDVFRVQYVVDRQTLLDDDKYVKNRMNEFFKKNKLKKVR